MGSVTNLNQNDTGNVIDTIATDSISAKRPNSRQKPLFGAYVALLLFMFIYWARPGDWIPGLSKPPLAKISGILILLALVFSLRHIRRPIPREVLYLIFLIGQLFLAAVLSPVWRGGAVQVTLDFAKVLIIAVVMAAAINTSKRLRGLIFIQAASVEAIALAAVLKGRLLVGRLEGTLGGNYSNPNTLALAIVISLPLCLAILFLSRGRGWKAVLALAILAMVYAVFLTGSRGGFLALIVAGVDCLWGFAIRGRRRYLLVLAAMVTVTIWQFSSEMMVGRLKGTLDPKENTASAYGSAQQRQQVFWRSIEVTAKHLLFGIGPGNFATVSGSWHVTHNSFTEMSSEGGVPAFILYVLILWRGFKNVRATKRFARGQRESILLARALHASLAGYLVGSLFASVAYQFFPYILVIYSSALLWITKKSISHPKEDETLSQVTPRKTIYGHTTDTNIEWSWHS
jgi:putative inorganic carbon (HCO3(-)) transporter